MKLLDDMNNKKANTDSIITLLKKAKEQGDNTVVLQYGYVGHEQYVEIVTKKE